LHHSNFAAVSKLIGDSGHEQVDAILAALVSQLEGRFPGVDFDPGQLRLTASAISRGTLRI